MSTVVSPLEDLGEGERGRPRFAGLLGECRPMRVLFEQMRKVAPSDVPVHIFGETGTGKERVARALHAGSPRAHRPFVALNASSLSDELFESEMFGHARGAFTGAVSLREGHVAAAEGGTLFLDEVTELTPRAQARLLRVLQEHEYRRLGETAVRRADVRILTASNVGLEERVARGLFRPDLLYRLNTLTLSVPPLRERGDDVLLLARRFLAQAAESRGVVVPALPRDVAAVLAACGWPGNVRQLENEMRRLVTLAEDAELRPEHLSPGVLHGMPRPVAQWRRARADFERQYLGEALERNSGNRTRTAAELGLSRQGLRLLIGRHGLSPGSFTRPGVLPSE